MAEDCRMVRDDFYGDCFGKQKRNTGIGYLRRLNPRTFNVCGGFDRLTIQVKKTRGFECEG